MATGFTPEKLRKIHAEFEAHLPDEPAFEDAETAPAVTRVSFAGTEMGMLMHLDFGPGGTQNVFLNPLVARTLLEGISEAGVSHRWWPAFVNGQVAIGPELSRADLDHATHIRSVRTDSVPAGILVVTDSLTWFMEPAFASAVAWSIDETGKRAGWWDPVYDLIPSSGSQN